MGRPFIRQIMPLALDATSAMTSSMIKLKRKGDRGHHWRTSMLTFMGLLVISSCAMRQVAIFYRKAIRDISFLGIPLHRNALHMAQWFRVSNAYSKSTNIRYNGDFDSTTCFVVILVHCECHWRDCLPVAC